MWNQIDMKDLQENVVSLIGDRWMLVTAGSKEKCGTMTASWGGIGVIWGKPSATIYIRPQRYTKQHIDRNEYFTLSFLPEEKREILAYCGKESGWKVDKVKECGLTLLEGEGGVPYFDEADLVLVCRKRYVQQMDGEAIPADAKEKFYPGQDYHTLYIGEIVEVLKKD